MGRRRLISPSLARGAALAPSRSSPRPAVSRPAEIAGDHVVRPAEQRGRGVGEHHRLALARSGLLGAQLGLGGLPPN